VLNAITRHAPQPAANRQLSAGLLLIVGETHRVIVKGMLPQELVIGTVHISG
jgi:hypothetical protein